MIRSNTDCPYCHDIFDQYCNLFKGYKNCDKSDCEVLKILKENEQLKQQIANTCNLSSKDGCLASDRYDLVVTENEQLKKDFRALEEISDERYDENTKLKQQIEKMKSCGNCKHRKIEVLETCKLLKKYTQLKGACYEWELAE